ncbi:hypothetical protein GCM10010398_73200 [Streptomyces fimbriatus]
MVSEVRAGPCRRTALPPSPAGDKRHLDEVFIRINGERKYLWRVVDRDGSVLDILTQDRRDKAAARMRRSRRVGPCLCRERVVRGQGPRPGPRRNTVAVRPRQARDRPGADLDDSGRRPVLRTACRAVQPTAG